ncbi:hypothetical protein ACWEJ6_11720 [Nonomuraea sp. NPDC004702]
MYQRRRLHPVGEARFGRRAADVCLGVRLGHGQLAADLPVGQAAGDGDDGAEVLKTLAAPIYLRLLITAEPVDDAIADQAVRVTLAAVRAGARPLIHLVGDQ